jgi:hypothetical protein
MVNSSGHGSATQNQTEYLEKYTYTNQTKDKVFTVKFTDDDLAKTPSWDPEKEDIPLSISTITKISRKQLHRYVQNSESWKIESIKFDRVGRHKWVCVIDFTIEKKDETGTEENFTVIMKMDGTFFEPEVTARNSSSVEKKRH